MKEQSALGQIGLWRQRHPQPASEPGSPSRRQLLQGGASAVAGLATFSGMELLQAPPAGAQDAVPKQTLVLISRELTGVSGSLCLCRHAYQFELESPHPPTSADQSLTYRLNFGGIDGGPAGDRLAPIFLPSPADPAAFPPAPSAPGELLQVNTYRSVQPLTHNLYRINERCALYSFEGKLIVISTIIGAVSYRPFLPRTGGPCGGFEDRRPVLSSSLGAAWVERSDASTGSSDPRWEVSNSGDSVSATAEWTVTFPLALGLGTVSALLPGSPDYQNRTEHARYEISNAAINESPAVVEINQQGTPGNPTSTSQWVTLADRLPFTQGSYKVRLTNRTGEPGGTRTVVASVISLSFCSDE